MCRKLLCFAVTCVVLLHHAPAHGAEPVFATPLPPGPGMVAMPIPGGPLVAPVLMPNITTVTPVTIYQMPTTAEPASLPVAAPVLAPTTAKSAGQFYGSVDFLYGATQGVYLPPLVTASPAGTPGLTAGALFRPTTQVLLGGDREGTSTRPGFRMNFGYLCDPITRCGVDAGFFFLGDTTESFDGRTAPGGVIILARPAVNGLTGENVGFPFGTTGPAGLAASFSTFTAGADVNWRRGIACDGKFDLLLGYRFLHLGDAVDIYSSQGGTAPGVGTLSQTTDRFHTQNQFHGPQVGFASHCELGGRFALDLMGKLGMGVTVSTSQLTGSTINAPGTLPAPAGGLLVAPTNAGSYTESQFAVVPEVGVKLGYGITDALRVSFGYSFIYWSRVQRAPDQIDLTLLTTGRPAFPNRSDDLWIQGWTAGLQWRY